MITRQFQELTLSALGFGAMRLPVLDGQDSRIDQKRNLPHGGRSHGEGDQLI